MKRTFSKKLLALLLVVVMAVALVPAAAFAADAPTIEIDANLRELKGEMDFDHLEMVWDWTSVTTPVPAGLEDIIKVTYTNKTIENQNIRIATLTGADAKNEDGKTVFEVKKNGINNLKTVKPNETVAFFIKVAEVGSKPVAIFEENASILMEDGTVQLIWDKHKKSSLNMEILDICVTEVKRLAGANRVETSIAAAELMQEKVTVDTVFDWTKWPLFRKKDIEENKYKNIVIANSKGFADAMSASYLAYVLEAPILLWDAKYEDALMAEVACLKHVKDNEDGDDSTHKVYIIGGTDAVSGAFETKLDQAIGYDNVIRLAGEDRYETNLIANSVACYVADDDPTRVFVATGNDFPDALSASALKAPVLLVNKELTDAQKAFLETGYEAAETFYSVWWDKVNNIATVKKATQGGSDAQFDKAYIVGGVNAVPAAVVKSVKDTAIGEVERIAGSDRYETSAAIAKRFFAGETETLVIATGKDFPDALCAGPIAAKFNAPVCLVDPGHLVSVNKFAGYKHRMIIMGGEAAVSDALVAEIAFATK